MSSRLRVALSALTPFLPVLALIVGLGRRWTGQ